MAVLCGRVSPVLHLAPGGLVLSLPAGRGGCEMLASKLGSDRNIERLRPGKVWCRGRGQNIPPDYPLDAIVSKFQARPLIGHQASETRVGRG